MGDRDVSIIRRAWEMAVEREPTGVAGLLAKSLHCYVSDDDIVLDRRAFLAMVKDRIEQDLETDRGLLMDDKERKQRQVAPILEMMLAAKKFDAYLGKLAIRVMEGTCTPAEELDAAPAAFKELQARMVALGVLNVWMPEDRGDSSPFHLAMFLAAHPDLEGATIYDVAKWVSSQRALRRYRGVTSESKS